MDGPLPRREPASHPITNNPSTRMLGLNIRSIAKLFDAIFSHITSIRRTNQGIFRMQNIIPAIYFAGHVGPFTAYRTAAYAITVATSHEKLALPKWRNNIVTMM